MRQRPGWRCLRFWEAQRPSPPACAAHRKTLSTCWRRWRYEPGCELTLLSCTPRYSSLPLVLSTSRSPLQPHPARMDACIPENRAHRLVMMRYNEPIHVSSAADASSADQVRLAALAYLARFTGSSREHTESDLRCFLRWCADRAAWTPWPRAVWTWSSTSGGCKKPAGSNPPPSHGGSRWPPGFTEPASSTAYWSTPGRACPQAPCPGRIANARVHSPSVRGVADRREVIEYGRASGLMDAVPDPFRPKTRHRVHDDPNEDEAAKALPERVIRQLDARLHLLGPTGRAGATGASHAPAPAAGTRRSRKSARRRSPPPSALASAMTKSRAPANSFTRSYTVPGTSDSWSSRKAAPSA